MLLCSYCSSRRVMVLMQGCIVIRFSLRFVSSLLPAFISKPLNVLDGRLPSWLLRSCSVPSLSLNLIFFSAYCSPFSFPPSVFPGFSCLLVLGTHMHRWSFLVTITATSRPISPVSRGVCWRYHVCKACADTPLTRSSSSSILTHVIVRDCLCYCLCVSVFTIK